MALGKGLGSLIPQGKSRGVVHKETAAPADQRIWHIPITEITANAEQPRKTFSHQDLEDLVASIKEHGVLQPILVSERDDGGYELIAGERRFRASTIAGLPTIPAIVKTANRQEKLELALIENIQRQDLNPIEEAFAYRRLMDEFHLTQENVSARVGKNRSTIANILRLLDLPDAIQKALADGKIQMGKAKALLSLKSPDEQLRVFAEMVGERASVRDVERAVAGFGSASRKGSVRRDPNLSAQERLLEDRIGSPVAITRRGDKGTIVISFFSNDEFKRLMQELS
jgi:ParB family chromosome partitioning protein